MAPPSKLTLLPEEIRQELEARLLESAFSGYSELSEWLKERLEVYTQTTLQLLAELALDDKNLKEYFRVLREKNRLEQIGSTICKSSLHKHGQKLKRKLEAIQTSTQAAQLLAESVPDDAGTLSSAVLSLVQTEMFDLLVNLQEVEDTEDTASRVKLLGHAAHAMADLARASLKQKEWAAGVQAKAQAAAEAVEKIAKRGGLNADTAAEIRREILGIAA